MKKYILIGDIRGIGGWQLYMNTRYYYLQQKGFDVYILYSTLKHKELIKLKHIKNSKKLNIMELTCHPFIFQTKQVNSIVDKFKEFISFSDGDDVFIESTCMLFSFWGELFAARTKGQNFAYLLHSHINGVCIDMKKFFEFKYNQQLIAGQTSITLSDLFEGYMEIPEHDNRVIAASWEAPICDNLAEHESLLNYLSTKKSLNYKIIGYFGTLNKPHFKDLCTQIANYTNSHSEKRFIFISIGSSFSGESEKAQKNISKTNANCETINVAELYPVPKTFFELMDVCISSWGSSRIAALSCHRTLRLIDDLTTIPQGIMGITIRKQPYHLQASLGISLFEILDNILFSDCYDDIKYASMELFPDYKIMQQQEDNVMQPFEKRIRGNHYYNIFMIKTFTPYEKKLSVLYKWLGLTITTKLRMLFNNIRSYYMHIKIIKK